MEPARIRQRSARRMAKRPTKPLHPLLVALPGALWLWTTGVILVLGRLPEGAHIASIPRLAEMLLATLWGMLVAGSLLCLVLACLRPRERWLALLANGSVLLVIVLIGIVGV